MLSRVMCIAKHMLKSSEGEMGWVGKDIHEAAFLKYLK